MGVPSQPVPFAILVVALAVVIPLVVFAIAWLLMKWSILTRQSSIVRRVSSGAIALLYTAVAVVVHTAAGARHRTLFFILAAFGFAIVALFPARDSGVP